MIESFQAGLGESVIGEEFLNFILDELGDCGVASILSFELVDKESLELFSLLDFNQSLLASLAQLS